MYNWCKCTYVGHFYCVLPPLQCGCDPVNFHYSIVCIVILWNFGARHGVCFQLANFCTKLCLCLHYHNCDTWVKYICAELYNWCTALILLQPLQCSYDPFPLQYSVYCTLILWHFANKKSKIKYDVHCFISVRCAQSLQ